MEEALPQELKPAQIGQIGTALLGHLIGRLAEKGVLIDSEIIDLKDSVVSSAPKDLQPLTREFLDAFLDVTG